VPDRDAGDTRQRFLAVAQELFASQGYAGTSIADIANRLGMSKASLYYHFRSKEDMIDALLAVPLAAYAELAETASAGRHTAEELLAAVIDTTVAARGLSDTIGNDPSVQAVLGRRAEQHQIQQINDALVAGLAGPRPGATAKIRAHAAFVVAKQGTLAVMAAGGGRLSRGQRAELVAAALRALSGPDR
jgi:AcrR family transcriptional regulator